MICYVACQALHRLRSFMDAVTKTLIISMPSMLKICYILLGAIR
jgi:hypothetical protein